MRLALGLLIAFMLILLPVALRMGTAAWATFLIILGAALGAAALVRRRG